MKWHCAALALLPAVVESAGKVNFTIEVKQKLVPLSWDPSVESAMVAARRFASQHDLQSGSVWALAEEMGLNRAWTAAKHRQSPEVTEMPVHVGSRVRSPELPTGQSVISLYLGHDSGITVSQYGRIQCVLELERYFNIRYFRPNVSSPADRYQGEWHKALRAVEKHCEYEDGQKPSKFTDGVIVFAGDFECYQLWLRGVVTMIFTVERWHMVDHHEAHALMGYYSSPFHSNPSRTTMVLSYDGAGNDGSFNVYVASKGKFQRIAQLAYSLGNAYDVVGVLLPEVSGHPLTDFVDCNDTDVLNTSSNAKVVRVGAYYEKAYQKLSWAGKMMGYSAVGEVREDLRESMRFLLEECRAFIPGGMGLPLPIVRAACESLDGQRAVAATMQSEFEEFFLSRLEAFLRFLGGKVDSIVLTGGCALNVLTNQVVHDKLSSGKTGRDPDFFVPMAPNDSGLTVGGVWSVVPPPPGEQHLQYRGFPLWDLELLPHMARSHGARRLSKLGGIDYLAELLAGGPAWQRYPNRTADKPIIAVVRGRQEFGPRALGHRSLLAVPDSEEMRDRMNRLKARAWYRPVAPMVADEAMVQVFGRAVHSPYMTMAPQVLPEIRKQFPAMAHLDGTARHQSVSEGDEPWIHALLLAVGRLTGLAALINTSFNSKGKPIVNRARECLKMLDELPDLDFVLIEDYLFAKRRPRSPLGTA
ncbi:unnamed protein product [Symbiodinium necroappetens]|uniref:Carbamoyltransferase C-terminal domain-containing protein n=1 Tax=Symbiodinium necroappetens TaxID=1628268 RepID=A0A812UNP9_9DINO|nr:unnamed protein product [Symbiodinium necroappetens]